MTVAFCDESDNDQGVTINKYARIHVSIFTVDAAKKRHSFFTRLVESLNVRN